MGIPEAYVQEWSRRLKESDPQAAKELFKAFYPRLYRYARGITNDHGQAEDVVQDTFLKLWNMRADLDPDKSLGALLFVMVRNQAYNIPNRKTRSLDDVALPSPGNPDHAQQMDNNELIARLREWIDALPHRRREAFHLSRFEGLSYEEIARVMDISVRTVENHIRLALQDLRDHIKEYEPNLLQK